MISNGVTGEHFFQGLANSRFDWRVNFARANRDEPDLREVLYQRPAGHGSGDAANTPYRARRRVAKRLPDVQHARRRDGRRERELGDVEQHRRPADAIQVRRQLRRAEAGFPVAPVPLHPGHPDERRTAAVDQLRCPPRSCTRANNIGTRVPVQRGDAADRRVRRPADDDRRIRHGGHRVLGASRLIAGARVEQFDQEVNTFDPFGLFVRTSGAANKNTDVFPGVNFVQAMAGNTNLRLSYSTTVNRPEFRELAEFEFTDVVGNRAMKGNPDLQRALIHNVDGRWEMFTGSRGVVAASVFYKYFDKPIERVVLARRQPLATFQNSDNARNFGVELELARDARRHFFVNANYTFVDSKITLLPEQRRCRPRSSVRWPDSRRTSST